MPSCRITNESGRTLNISLKQVTALHFENAVEQGQTVKFRPGKVWFTVECLHDEGPGSSSRYSVMKSAATIAVISLATVAVAATAGAALMPEAVVVAGGATAVAITKGLTLTKSALLTHSGTITKVSGLVLPKVVDKFTSQAGGLSALQKEVLSIVSSPTLSSDVRKKSASLLRSLHTAYRSDKATKRKTGEAGSARVEELSREEEEALRELEEFEMVERGKDDASEEEEGRGGEDDKMARMEEAPPREPLLQDKQTPFPTASTSSATSNLLDRGKTLFQRRRSGPASTGNSSTTTTASASSAPPHPHADVEHGEPAPVQTARTLRVHRVYMSERRHFAVRTRPDGRMELVDVEKGEVVK